MTSSSSVTMVLRFISPLYVFFFISVVARVSANFYTDVDVTWGNDRAKVLDNGQQLQLTLDRTSGSGFQSKNEYLFAKIDTQIKLVPGDSAGTVTAYYLSSQGSNHDEIDFEFLGNLSGDPYIMHTNIFSQGLGNREQQFYLWFDPTKDFHTYSVLWNPQQIILSVDGTPIRVFRNSEDLGVAYPNKQPMRVYSSLWNADDWATRGGLVKIDWTKAPFVASFGNFQAQSLGSTQTTATTTASEDSSQQQQQLQQKLNWVRENYMIYDYCADSKRFPQGSPKECSRQTLA